MKIINRAPRPPPALDTPTESTINMGLPRLVYIDYLTTWLSINSKPMMNSRFTTQRTAYIMIITYIIARLHLTGAPNRKRGWAMVVKHGNCRRFGDGNAIWNYMSRNVDGMKIRLSADFNIVRSRLILGAAT